MGQRPTYEDENGFYSATLSPRKRCPPLCHLDRSAPGFPASLPWTGPRVRLSLRKGAYCSPAQPTSTGNPGERSGEISVLMPLLGNVFDRILLGAVFEDLFCQVVFYLGLIAHHFVVGGSQELGAAVAQLLADVLLHSRVVQLTLSGRFLFYQLVDCVAHRSFRARGQYWNNVCDLSWL